MVAMNISSFILFFFNDTSSVEEDESIMITCIASAMLWFGVWATTEWMWYYMFQMLWYDMIQFSSGKRLESDVINKTCEEMMYKFSIDRVWGSFVLCGMDEYLRLKEQHDLDINVQLTFFQCSSVHFVEMQYNLEENGYLWYRLVRRNRKKNSQYLLPKYPGLQWPCDSTIQDLMKKVRETCLSKLQWCIYQVQYEEKLDGTGFRLEDYQ